MGDGGPAADMAEPKEETEATDHKIETTDSQGREFISLAEVSKHATKEDAWFVIHDKVYDISKYFDEHPGGEEVLMDRLGQNASEDFDDVGHSQDAKKTLAKYEVGELPPGERSTKTSNGSTSGGGGGVNVIAAVLVIVVAAMAGVYYYSTLDG